jgi:hypothetical protein
MEHDPVYRLGGKREYNFTRGGESATRFHAIGKGQNQQHIEFHITKTTPNQISGRYTIQDLDDEGTFWLKRPTGL